MMLLVCLMAVYVAISAWCSVTRSTDSNITCCMKASDSKVLIHQTAIKRTYRN